MDNLYLKNGRSRFGLLAFFLLFLVTNLLAQPANDDPCDAIDLSVLTLCSSNSFTTDQATNSVGVPSPGCGNFSGGDVWFSVVMPSNGLHTMIELQGSGSFDGGLAVYTGSNCNSLFQIGCDDNGGGGMNPAFRIEDGCLFENAGATFWIRVWENGNDNNGAFDICAYSTSAPIAGEAIICDNNYIAGDACCDAILLGADELDGYCGNTQGYSNNPGTITNFCANIENNSWIAFIASDPTVELEIVTSNCNKGKGIQVQIFGTDDCQDFTPMANCWNPGVEASTIMTAENMIEGDVYYLHIDGWLKDTCDYELNVISGIETTTVTATAESICLGESTQLQAIAVGSGPYTYSWSPVTGLTDPNSATTSASPSITTTYVVTIGTPSGNISESVTINVAPASPTVPVLDGPTSICRNATGLTYDFTSTGASIFNWTVNGGTIVGPDDGATITVDWGFASGSVCIDGSNGCGTAPQVCVNVTTFIEPDASIIDPPAQCFPTTIDLSGIAISFETGIGVPSYHPNETAANARWPIINPPIVDTSGVYWIRVTAGEDCYDLIPVNVTIEYPEVVVSQTFPTCDSYDLTTPFVNTGPWGTGTRSYFADSLDAVNDMYPLTSTTVTIAGTYWLRFETANGCIDVVPIPVDVEPTPDLSIDADLVICDGDEVDLSTVSYTDANNAPISVTKYFPDKLSADFNFNEITNTLVSVAKTYFIRVETDNGCVNVVPFDVVTANDPEGEINGGNMVCPGDDFELFFDLNGTGPFDVTYTDGTNNFTLTGISDGHTEIVTLSADTDFTLVSLTDETTCAGNVVGNAVEGRVHTPPTVAIAGNTTICGNTAVPLTFTLTGTGPFDVILHDDFNNNDISLTDIVDGHVETLNAAGATNYTIVSVTDDNGCEGTFSGTAVISYYAPLEAINVNETCSASVTGYTVSFEITGGDPTSYSVTGDAGTLVGNVFTSNEIPNNTVYNFTVTDNSNCPDVVLTGLRDCACSTDAGSMQLNTLESCSNGIVNANSLHNNDESLGVNDLLLYALHDNAGTILGNVFAINATAEFGLLPGMVIGTTYYISPIAGPDNGSGSIDQGHICFTVGEGVPVVFHALPQGTITGSTSVCSGVSATLTFNFNVGTPPFDVVFTDGTNNVSLDDITDGYTTNVSPSINTTYSIVSITDNTSSTCEGSGSGLAEVRINQAPQAGTINFNCNSTNTEYQVVFQIIGGEPTSYVIDDGTFDISNNTFTSDWIPSGDAYNFDIDDANNCGPTNINGNYACDCTTATVVMDTEVLRICEDETAIGSYADMPVLDGDDVLGFVLHDSPNNVLGNVLLTNSIPEFDYDPMLTLETTYYISAIAGNDDGTGFPVLDSSLDPCLGISIGQPVIFSELPTATLVLDTTICEGDLIDLVFNITGAGPFDISYSDGTDTTYLNGVDDGHLITLIPEESTTYTLLNVQMTNAPTCEGTVDGTQNMAMVNLIDIPEVENIAVTCNEEGTAYVITFDITGGNPLAYDVDVGVGVLTGSSYESLPIPSGEEYYFEIHDGTGCGPLVISAVEYCNCTPDIQPDLSLNEPVTCAGSETGSLAVTNINGEAPFTFTWSHGEVGEQVDSLGTGWYTVTMTDGNNCNSVDSIFLSEPDSVRAEMFPTSPSCFGENDGTISIESMSGGVGNYTYVLDDPDASYIESLFFKLESGTYHGTVTDANGCIWEGSTEVEDPEEVIAELGEDQLITFGDSTELNVSFNQAIDSFYWSPSNVVTSCNNSSCRSVNVQPFETTTFTVTAINEFGCMGTGEVTVNVNLDRPVYIPSAFSPNGDDWNDDFTIYTGEGVEMIQTLKIFNRWGAEVFGQDDIKIGIDSFGWDGKFRGRNEPNGVYIYFAEIKFADGKTEIFRGDVTLLR